MKEPEIASEDMGACIGCGGEIPELRPFHWVGQDSSDDILTVPCCVPCYDEVRADGRVA